MGEKVSQGDEIKLTKKQRLELALRGRVKDDAGFKWIFKCPKHGLQVSWIHSQSSSGALYCPECDKELRK